MDFDLRKFCDKFWSQVDKTSTCWLWRGHVLCGGYKGKFKYGRIGVGGVRWRTHIVSWTMVNGSVPDGKNVLHTCDNTLCVRPDHLFLGDPLINRLDCKQKGRMNISSGEKHYAHKLTIKAVLDIRLRFRKGETFEQLAKRYDVSSWTIRNAATRKRWKSVV